MQYKRKIKAAREEKEGRGREQGNPSKESTSGRASTGDCARGEFRSKNREDTGGRRRPARLDVGMVMGSEVEVTMGDYVVRHRCAFDSICTLVDELSEAQREAIRGMVWGPVLEYKKFAMDRFLVEALIQAWNPERSTFLIGG